MLNVTKYCHYLILLAFLFGIAFNSKAGLIYCNSPEGGRDHVRLAIEGDFRGAGFLNRIPPDQLTILDPLRLYDLDLITNFDSTFLLKAEFECWQYRLLYGTNAIGLCDVSPSHSPTKTPIIAGPYAGNAQEMLFALNIAASLPQVKVNDYEIRKINYIFVSFQAIWLHGEKDDIIIPLPRAYPDTAKYFEAYHPYKEAQMAKIMHSMLNDEMLRSNSQRP